MVYQSVSYRDTIYWLFNLQFFGIKLGLENITAMAAQWEHPERRYPVIHIAGSNGKGSTASFIAAALQSAGYRTGLYTSPHLADFSERIRVDGQPIDEAEVVRYAERLRPQVDALNATFFEATTLMAFQYFAEKEVDVAVIETGLGGRLDATNIVTPILSVITSLSLEHREHLGGSIAEIAREKGGIIKHGVPVVTSARQEEARAELTKLGQAGRAPLFFIDAAAKVERVEDLDRMICRLPEFEGEVEIGLVGEHQLDNARLAVTGLRLLKTQFPRLHDDAIRTGLRDVATLTGLRGRLQKLQTDPELVVDVCHNADGAEAMLRTWSAVRDMSQTDLVFGLLKTKDIFDMFTVLKQYPARSITLVEAVSHEARSLEEMQQAAAAAGIQAHAATSIEQGVRDRLDAAGCGSVLLFGSHYVVGDFLKKRFSS